MRTFAFALVGLCIAQTAGCASRKPPNVAPTASSVAAAEAPTPPFDLTGEWATGSGPGEPAGQLITLRPPCLQNPAAWILQQTGDSLEGIAISESHDQGTAPKEPMRIPPTARGRVKGLDVTLDAPSLHYQLRYDPGTEHLRGSLNDRPFWAVRQVVERPGGCLPPP
jgi:hypothetical protein